MAPASGVLARINPEFLHSRKKSRAVHAHACGGPIGPADSPLRLGERPNDRVPLFLSILPVHAAVGVKRFDGFFHNPGNVFLPLLDALGLTKADLTQFSQRSL